LEQARALLDFLAASCTGGDPAYQALLTRELDILRQCNDSYLFHEHLEDVNEPMFFHEFVEQASRHQLRYLAEPYLREMVAVNIDPKVNEVLQKLGANIVHFEQYLDFLRNRTFDQMRHFRVTSLLKRRNSAGTISDDIPWEFTRGGQSVGVSNPIHKATLWCLEQAGLPGLWCGDLVQRAIEAMTDCNAMRPLAVTVEGEVRDLVLQLHVQGLLELSINPPRFVSEISERPIASSLARRQSAAGQVVTNLRHEQVKLEPLDRELIRRLDGCHNRTELVEFLGDALRTGEMTISNTAGPLPPDEQTSALLGGILEHGLNSLAGQGLLQE
ncbi:MAG: methyltransferase regulatory domain-containing protein, partial [Planctomycetota bacterium]|nr:methyltransferase regulatory domain-containing protein [Planctomycetota bacterium]